MLLILYMTDWSRDRVQTSSLNHYFWHKAEAVSFIEFTILSQGTEPRNWGYFLKRAGPTLEVPCQNKF